LGVSSVRSGEYCVSTGENSSERYRGVQRQKGVTTDSDEEGPVDTSRVSAVKTPKSAVTPVNGVVAITLGPESPSLYERFAMQYQHRHRHIDWRVPKW